LNSGYSSANAGIVCNVVLLIEGHIEIDTNQRPLVAEVVLGELRHKHWFGVSNKGFPNRKPLLKLWNTNRNSRRQATTFSVC
jgi:hypothetical protein